MLQKVGRAPNTVGSSSQDSDFVLKETGIREGLLISTKTDFQLGTALYIRGGCPKSH